MIKSHLNQRGNSDILQNSSNKTAFKRRLGTYVGIVVNAWSFDLLYYSISIVSVKWLIH